MRTRMPTTRSLAIAALSLTLGACTPMTPFRTALATDPAQPADCSPQDGRVAAACARTMLESSTKPPYDLHFVEFDDQGLQYPDAGDYSGGNPADVGEARQQIDTLINRLSALPRGETLSLLVFVHGWKNNAAYDNGNVESFRRVLAAVSRTEADAPSGTPRRVVGVYVGWRGLSATVEPFTELSFWDRKFTAEKVAVGSVRALFARLKAFQCDRNGGQTDTGGRSRDGGCRGRKTGDNPNVRMLLIGHSFGGLIMYNAIAEDLIESLTYDLPTGRKPQPATRFGDMVILLNPAFEATRYTPLFRAAQRASQIGYQRYQAPIFVSVTTRADWATGLAFPFGRFLNTLFEREASSEEQQANRNTIGHVQQYITHTLLKSESETCPGWKLDPSTDAEIRNNQELEKQASRRFFADYQLSDGKLKDPWTRPFCGNMALQLLTAGETNGVKPDPDSPIWNVATDKPIMNGHSDITNAYLESFVRQLYQDVVLYPFGPRSP